MANRKNTLLFKRSNVSGKKPLTTDLELGELAINSADAAIFMKNSSTDTIVPIGWDRVSKTGDTINGDLTIVGELNVSVEYWTVELMDSFDIVFYADRDMSITDVININNTPTIVINVNGVLYDMGDPISTGDEIEVISDIASVIKIKTILT